MRYGLLAVLLLAGSVQAAGFYFGENGSKTLIQGGAFTAQADDLSAIQHNPSGLAQLQGLHFNVDTHLVFQKVTFQRQDPGFDPANPSTRAVVTESASAPYYLPLFGVSYGLKVGGRGLTFGLGLTAPPSAGRSTFPSPNYAKDASGNYIDNPIRSAGHRYLMVSEDIIIVYPSLSVAFEVHPKLLIGLSAQLVVSNYIYSQALYSGLTTPTRFTAEDPTYDSIAGINMPGQVTATGVIGALFRPIDQLAFGASFRPPIPLRAVGKMNVQLGEFAKSAGVEVTGDQAELRFTMPFELRLGARVRPIERLGVNLDFVYQGWSSVDAQVLTPLGVTLGFPSDPNPKAVQPIRNEKHWKNTWSLRLGGAFDVHKLLTLHAGAWYESQSSDDAYFNIDWPSAERVFITGGVSVHLGPIDLIAGVAGTPTVTKNVVQSELRAPTSDPEIPGNIVGAGIFTTGGWIATLGVHGHFFDKPAADTSPKQ